MSYELPDKSYEVRANYDCSRDYFTSLNYDRLNTIYVSDFDDKYKLLK